MKLYRNPRSGHLYIVKGKMVKVYDPTSAKLWRSSVYKPEGLIYFGFKLIGNNLKFK